MFVGLYLLVGKHNAQVDSRSVHFALVAACRVLSQEVEVVLQRFSRTLHAVVRAVSVKQQAQFMGRFRLGRPVLRFLSDVQHFIQMLDGFRGIITL